MRRSLVSKLTSVSFLLLLPSGLACLAQTPTPSPATSDEKAEKIVAKAVQAMGGDRYLTVKSVVGHGFFTEFKDGVSGIPVRFVDYIVYPDKERTEFIGGGQRLIQTNDRDRGWIYDGAALTLKDQTAAQIDDFRMSTRTGIENLLRGGWRSQGAKLSYIGRREAGLARRNETVRLTYPDGFWIEYEFAADTGQPAKVLYQRKEKKRDGDEVEEVPEEDRLYKPITINGIIAPYVIDHFRNGQQTSRLNYDSVEFNKPVADALFAKPASFKALK